MGAFRCVSNTKQQALCSLLLSPPRHALANPWTFCRKTQNQTTEPLFSSMFFFQAVLLFFIPIYLYFSPIQYFCSPFVLFFFNILCLSTQNVLPYYSQSSRFHICYWTTSGKPNHMPSIAANYPGSRLSS